MKLTHRGFVTSYGVLDLGQVGIMWLLPAAPFTNMDLL